MEPAIWPTLADAVQLLEARGIEFALIGGLAVSLRGQPRMTVDVDLVMLSDVERALELVREIDSTPFAPLFPGVEEVVARSSILPLRHRTTGIRVDVAIGMSGFERQAVRRAAPVSIGAVRVPVVATEDLLVMKALAGRPQDEEDIRGLIAVQRDAIDWPGCLDLPRRLGAATVSRSRRRVGGDGATQPQHPHPACGRPLPKGEAKGHTRTLTNCQLLDAPGSNRAAVAAAA